eukprot:gene16894-biopygen2278
MGVKVELRNPGPVQQFPGYASARVRLKVHTTFTQQNTETLGAWHHLLLRLWGAIVVEGDRVESVGGDPSRAYCYRTARALIQNRMFLGDGLRSAPTGENVTMAAPQAPRSAFRPRVAGPEFPPKTLCRTLLRVIVAATLPVQ